MLDIFRKEGILNMDCCGGVTRDEIDNTESKLSF